MSTTAHDPRHEPLAAIRAAREPAPPSLGRFVNVGSGRAHYLEAGSPDGPPVILLHGLATLAQEILTPLAPTLKQSGYRILALDRPGYGRSDPLPEARNGPFAQAAWLGRVADALGASRPLIVAHSIGAAPALSMACDPGRRVAGLVLLSPFVRPTPPAPAPLLRIATAPGIGGIVRRFVLPPLASRLGPAMIDAASGSAQSPLDPAAFPWRTMADGAAVEAMAGELKAFNLDMERLGRGMKLNCRAIVLAGREDDVIDMPAHVEWLTARVPEASVRWLDGQSHLIHHGHPQCVAEALAEVGHDRLGKDCADPAGLPSSRSASAGTSPTT